jgi:hypothetical protein
MQAKRVSLFRKVFCEIRLLVFRHCLCRWAQWTRRKGAFVHRNGQPLQAAACGCDPRCSSYVRSNVRFMSSLLIGSVISRGGGYGTMLLQVCGDHPARASQHRRQQARRKGNQ